MSELANFNAEFSNATGKNKNVPEGVLYRILTFLQARHVGTLRKNNSTEGFIEMAIDRGKNYVHFQTSMRKFGNEFATVAAYIFEFMEDSNEMNTRDNFLLKMKLFGYEKLAHAVLGQSSLF